jgi:hypothetical protein
MSTYRNKKCTCLFPSPHWGEGHFLHKKSKTYQLYGKQVPECLCGCPIHDKKSKIKR